MCLQDPLFLWKIKIWKSSIAEDYLEIGHQILFDNVSILAKSSNYVDWKTREAIEVIKHFFNSSYEAGTFFINLVHYSQIFSFYWMKIFERIASVTGFCLRIKFNPFRLYFYIIIFLLFGIILHFIISWSA